MLKVSIKISFDPQNLQKVEGEPIYTARYSLDRYPEQK